MDNIDKANALATIKMPLKTKVLLGEITYLRAGESQAGRERTDVSIAPVEDNVVQRDLALHAYISIPTEDDLNSKDPRVLKAVGFIVKNAKDFFEAIGEIPRKPKFVSKGTYRTADGVTLNQQQFNELVKQRDRLAGELTRKLLSDEDYRKSLMGKRVYFEPQAVQIDENTGEVKPQFIKGIYPDLRPGTEALTHGVVDDEALSVVMAAAGLADDTATTETAAPAAA